jgi:hypothetical protein
MDSGTARLPFMPKTAPVIPTEQQVAGGKGDIPAGLLTDTPAAPAAPAAPAPAPGAPAPEPGLQASPYYPPAAAAGDVVPRVTQDDYAGLNAPGQGSIADQIMRAPAGQAAALPDTGMYLVEPMAVQNELRQLAARRDLLARQFEVARKRRDFPTMQALQEKAEQINAATNLMEAMEVISQMQQGDDDSFARAASGLTDGRMRLQPIQPNGGFNVYYDGTLVGENVDRNKIIASLRMEYDQRYQAMVGQRVAAAQERDGKILDSELKRGEQINEQTAIFLKERGLKTLETDIKQRFPKYGVQTAVDADGQPILWVTPDNGGAPMRFGMEIVIGVDGQPLLDATGQPKMKPVRKDFGATNTVPVQ